jgi:hypothetical protein
MGVKVQLPTIKDRIKKLNKFSDKILFPVALRLKVLLLQNYSRSKGADGQPLPGLTEAYKAKKIGGKRNFLLSGKMLLNLTPTKKGFNKWLLKFTNTNERDKARGNVKHAPNMMAPISDRIDQKLQKLAFKLWTK